MATVQISERSGNTPVSAGRQAFTDEIREIEALLDDLVYPDEKVRWLNAPQEQLNEQSPMQLIQQGQGERIRLIVLRHLEGIPA